jgi:hypothetical protein
MISPDLLAALYESLWISSQKEVTRPAKPARARSRKKHTAEALRRTAVKKRTPRLYATIS